MSSVSNDTNITRPSVEGFYTLLDDFFLTAERRHYENGMRDLLVASTGHFPTRPGSGIELAEISNISFDMFMLAEFIKDLSSFSILLTTETNPEIDVIMKLHTKINIREMDRLLNRSFNMFVFTDEDSLDSLTSIIETAELFKQLSELLQACEVAHIKNETFKGGIQCLK